jgi:tetratricopeptide (TPR) repeat protein
MLSGALLLATLVFSQAFLNTFPSPKLLVGTTLAFGALAFLVLAGGRPGGPLAAPLAATSAWAVVELFARGYPDGFSLSLLPILVPAGAALAATGLSPRESSRVMAGLLAAQLGVGLYAILQFLGVDPFTWTLDFGRARVFSALGNPNFLAGQMVLAIPLAAAVGTLSRGPERWLGRAAFATSLLAMVFAQTRGAWLGLLAGALAAAGIAAGSRGWRAAAEGLRRGTWALVTAAVILLPFLFSRTNPTGISLPSELASSTDLGQRSARQRFFWGHAAAVLVAERPVRGGGLGGFQADFPLAARAVLPPYSDLPPAFADHPHNDWLFRASELGLIGLGLCVWIAVAWMRVALLYMRNAAEGDAGALAWASAWAIPGLAVHALWNMPSTILATSLGAGVMAGLTCPAGAGRDAGEIPPRGIPILAAAAIAVLALSFRPAILLLGQGYLNAARLADADQKLGPAAFLAKQVLRLTRAPWRVHFMLGRAYYGQGYYEEALKEFRADEGENPWSADAVLHQGKALRQMGSLLEAETECRRALRLVPNYPDAAVTIASTAWFRASEARRLGDRSAERKQMARTRTWLEYALRFSPTNGEALRLLGHLEYRLGNKREAVAAWEGYLREKPRDGMMREVVSALKANPDARVRLLEGKAP